VGVIVAMSNHPKISNLVVPQCLCTRSSTLAGATFDANLTDYFCKGEDRHLRYRLPSRDSQEQGEVRATAVASHSTIPLGSRRFHSVVISCQINGESVRQ
jgi:hypothetical protein